MNINWHSIWDRAQLALGIGLVFGWQLLQFVAIVGTGLLVVMVASTCLG